MTKHAERNGEQEGSEPGTNGSPDSPKKVVFRSTSAKYTLAFRAGYMDKSHGLASYVPSDKEVFNEFYLYVDATPANQKRIERIRNHPQNGIAFREVPDATEAVELPTIAEMKAMSLKELKELCRKRNVAIKEDASKDAIMLSLIEKQ